MVQSFDELLKTINQKYPHGSISLQRIMTDDVENKKHMFKVTIIPDISNQERYFSAYAIDSDIDFSQEQAVRKVLLLIWL